MSIQKLFSKEKNIKSLSSVTMDQLAQDAESELYIHARAEDSERFVPPINYLQPEEFVNYGLAEKYYVKSFDYIRKTYPYDGSLYEKQAWHNTASNLDNYLFEHKYPRTTGHAIFSPGTWGSVSATSTAENYGLSSDIEYISVNSGPSGDKNLTGSIQSLYSNGELNVYDVSKNREDNLKFDLSGSGVTLEFWLKKESFDITKTGREVIFDMWNGAESGSASAKSDNYGRLRLEMTGGVDAGTFLFTALSGASGVQYAEIGTTVTTASVATNTWNHFALSLKNSGSAIKATLYKNGMFVESVSTGSIINRVYPTSGTIANLGSLRYSISGNAGSTAGLGYGKFSGSIDDFRYWKTERTPLQISRFWFSHVGGGTNTDDNTTDLGLYYKFNEGITGTSSIDQSVLDYSGRVSNGTWVGYAPSARSTDSAIESYSTNFKETKDVIIYSNHPDYSSAYTEMQQTGSTYDVQNLKSLYHYFPQWILEGDSSGVLEDITQIMSSYLDELALQIKFLPRLNDNFYLSGSTSKPVSFAQKKLLSRGFLAQDLFTNANVTETLMNNDGERNYDSKIDLVRNFIYENIYNNLTTIYKSKGTEKSFNRLLHCFGIDQDIFKINVYSTNDEYDFKDNFKTVSNRTKLLSMNTYSTTSHAEGTVYQFSSSGDANTVSYLTGNSNVNIPMTFESEFLFPKNQGAVESPYAVYSDLTSSLFGIHTAQTEAGGGEANNLTWATPDVANFQVYAEREYSKAEKVKFVLTSSDTSGIPHLTSSFYDEVYDNNQWNFAVKVHPLSPVANRAEGSEGIYLNSATATMLVISENPAQYRDMKFTLISTDGTTKTYHLHDATHDSYETGDTSPDGSSVFVDVKGLSTRATIATQIKNAIEHSNGHNGKLTIALSTTTSANDTITITQAVAGDAGNTTIAAITNGNASYLTINGAATATAFSGGTSREYVVEFYGVSTVGNTIIHEFSVSSSMNYTKAVNFMTSSKRMYVGAHYTNFTSGAPLQSTDVRVLSSRIWLDNLTTEELRHHAYDIDNYGRYEASRNAYLYISGTLGDVNIPRAQTLALNWDFSTVTSSDGSGNFTVQDVSSGSADLSARYGQLSTALNAQHPGIGHGFPASTTDVIDIDYILSAKQKLPEIIQSSDMINVLTDEEIELYTRNSLPVKYMLSIEKSMYQTVSEEMLNIFSSINDFNNLIGEPVNRYRQNYKGLEKLRHLFYEKVNNVPDVEKYVDFYKWFDSSVVEMLSQLIPATALRMDNAANIIESHVLERNKYWNKFPTLDTKHTIPEAIIKGQGELAYDWKYGHANILKSAGAVLEIKTANPGLLRGMEFTMVSSDGTSKTYVLHDALHDDYETGAINHGSYLGKVIIDTKGLSSKANIAAQVKAALEHANGHAGKLTVSYALGVVTIGQSVPGSKGNTTISAITLGSTTNMTINGGITASAFTGGTGGENENCFWWQNRVARNNVSLTSGDAATDLGRNHVLWTKTTEATSSGQSLTNVDGTNYNLDNYFLRNNTKTYTYELKEIKNKYIKNNDIYKGLIPSSGSQITIKASEIDDVLCSDDKDASLYDGYGIAKKHKLSFQFDARTGDNLDIKRKGTRAAPFNFYTSSVTTGYMVGSNLTGAFKNNVEINDLHRDLYHTFENEPLQSPFTERYVGGMPHRHGNVLESEERLRQEAYYIEPRSADNTVIISNPGLSSSANPSRYFRDSLAKRPVNIKNIKSSSESAKAAIAIIQVKTTNPGQLRGMEFTIESTDGTSKTYILHDALHDDYETGAIDHGSYAGKVLVDIKGLSSLTTIATEIANALNHANGHELRLSTSVTLGVLTVTQRDAGVLGNTNISAITSGNASYLTINDVITATAFYSGRNESATNIGNYDYNYQVVQTLGRDVNNLWFRSGSTGLGGISDASSSSTAISGAFDFTLPDRTLLDNGARNKTVIAERFSAPGGPEVLSRGYLDSESETYSVYNSMNYRNSIVRDSLNYFSQISQTKFGNTGTAISGSANVAYMTAEVLTTNPGLLRGYYLTLTSADQTTKTYVLHDALHDDYETGAIDSPAGAGKVLVDTKGLSSLANIATQIKTAIEHANGHAGKLTADVSSGLVTVKQVVSGATGVTHIPKDGGSGGADWNTNYFKVNGDDENAWFIYDKPEQYAITGDHYQLANLGTASYHHNHGNSVMRPTISKTARTWNTAAKSFDGTNDYLTRFSLDNMESMKYTWSIWFKPDSTGGSTDYLIEFGNNAQYLHYNFTSEIITFSHSGTSAGTWTSPSNKITEDAWNHVAISYDATSTSTTPLMCINGESVTPIQTSAPAGLLAIGTSLNIGRKATGAYYFKGSIDDVAIFNRNLDTKELQLLYKPLYAHTEGNPAPFNLTQHPAAAHLVSWWRMGDGEGDSSTAIVDQVALYKLPYMLKSTNNNLTINGVSADTNVLSVDYYEVELEEFRDNAYIRHAIPRSDKQYSWITASLEQNYQHGGGITGDTLLLDHQRNNQYATFVNTHRIDGQMSSSFNTVDSSGYVQSLNFMSSSDLVIAHFLGGAVAGDAYHKRTFGYGYNWWFGSSSANAFGFASLATGIAGYDEALPQDFVGLNTDFVDDFVTSSNNAYIAGFINPDVPIIDSASAYHSQYCNYFTVFGVAGVGSSEYSTIALGSEPMYPFLNHILTRRNGQYGYPTWKQIRAGQTQIPRNLFKKQNIYNVIDTYKEHPTPYSWPDNIEGQKVKSLINPTTGVQLLGHDPNQLLFPNKDLTFINFKEPALTSRCKPIRQTLMVKHINEDTGEILEDNEISLAYAYTNNLTTFANPGLVNRIGPFIQSAEVSLYENIKDTYMGPGKNSENNPVNSMKELILTDKIYPKAEYTYLTKNRTREKYYVNFWKSSRVTKYDYYSNSRRKLIAPNLERDIITDGRTSYNSLQGYTGAQTEPLFVTVNHAVSSSNIASTGSMAQVITVFTSSAHVGAGVTGDSEIRDSFMANQSVWPLDARAEFLTGRTMLMKKAAVGTRLTMNPYNTSVFTKLSGGYSGVLGAGELQNDYTIFHNGDPGQYGCDYSKYASSPIMSGAAGGSAGLRAGVLYSRPILSPESVLEPGEVFLEGDTLWEAGTQRAISLNVGGSDGQSDLGDGIDYGPTYETYEDFSKELKFIGKDYTVVPEFKISDHMSFYIKENKGNFKTINGKYKGPDDWLTLTGSSLTSSAFIDKNNPANDFFHVYSSSDFIKNFEVIREDHEELTLLGGETYHANKLSLRCRALMKFLPYDGFFPANRTVQLASMFSQSYGDIIKWGDSSAVGYSSAGHGAATSAKSGHLRTAISPLFAPGILYNTIKGGIAVDYPIMTSSYANIGTMANSFTHTASAATAGDTTTPVASIFSSCTTAGGVHSQYYDFRVPFETLLDPEEHLEGINIVDLEPHPSASINSTASISAPVDDLYKMAMHNFLAEVPSFFLKKDSEDPQQNAKGDLTSFISMEDGNWKEFEANKKYAMEVVLSNGVYGSNFNTLHKNTVGHPLLSAHNKNKHMVDQNLPSIITYERNRTPDGTKDNGTAAADQNRNRKNFGSSFGPGSYLKSSTGTPVSGNVTYMPHTPPHYGGGLARCIVAYSQSSTHTPTIDEVLSKAEFIYDRVPDYWNATGIGVNSAMPLSSSLNLKQRFTSNLKKKYNQFGQLVGFDEAEPGTSINRWAIQTKFETPSLDFSGVTVQLPVSGSGSVAKGIWHQYAQPSEGNKGVKLTIKDVDPHDVYYGSNGSISSKWDANVQSLAKAVGFLAGATKKKTKKIGEIADSRIIKEAIVAIPFRGEHAGLPKDQISFYTLPKEFIRYVKSMSVDGKGDESLLPDAPPEGGVIGPIKKIFPSKTIIDMVKKMQEYVIPPHLDFVTNTEFMSPFVAYIFPFEHELTKNDLADIWQNLSPPSLMKVKEPKESVAEIEHTMLVNDFFGMGLDGITSEIDSKTQWMVFKVKQKASMNYYDKTADSYDQFKFIGSTAAGQALFKETSKFLGQYSYNWPYDFFSMVELVNLESKVTFKYGKKLTKGIDLIP